MTHKMKSFATDVTHKYVYGIIFMLLSLVLMPQTYVSIMSYFFFISMIVALVGYIMGAQMVILVSNACGMIFSGAIGIGLLVYHWEWMTGR